MMMGGEETPGLAEHVKTGGGGHGAMIQAGGGGYGAETVRGIQWRIQPVLKPGP